MSEKLTQEEINVLAAEFNYTPEGNEPECFAKALTLCQRFKRERDERIRENEELKEALMDMVAQHCFDPEVTGRYFSNALHANSDAMRLLGKLGLMKIEDRGMRIVFGWWPENNT